MDKVKMFKKKNMEPEILRETSKENITESEIEVKLSDKSSEKSEESSNSQNSKNLVDGEEEEEESMEIVQNFGYVDKDQNQNQKKSQNSEDEDHLERTIYIFVEPSELGSYVMSVGWSDINILEKMHRRKMKLFSKDHKQYISQCSQIYQKNKISRQKIAEKKSGNYLSYV